MDLIRSEFWCVSARTAARRESLAEKLPQTKRKF
jgi:hypothetical protein